MRKRSTDDIETRRVSPEQITDDLRIPLAGVLENVRSLYNVGSIFRTSDAVLLRELVLTGYTPVPPRKEIEKTALGATRTVPWRRFPTSREAILTLRSEGYAVLALEMTDRSDPLFQAPLPATPVALVIGNEISGVSQQTLDLCDRAVEIPMYGSKHSLNVAVAFGIAVFELSRRLRMS